MLKDEYSHNIEGVQKVQLTRELSTSWLQANDFIMFLLDHVQEGYVIFITFVAHPQVLVPVHKYIDKATLSNVSDLIVTY